MKTLLLDPETWDLTVNNSGNIASVGDVYSQAQDAASAIKLFSGELWYDTTKGVPYWAQILGKMPALAVVRSYFEVAALTVPGVVQAACFFSGFVHRRLTGQVQVTDEAGNIAAAGF